jgi:hypothetical protein
MKNRREEQRLLQGAFSAFKVNKAKHTSIRYRCQLLSVDHYCFKAGKNGLALTITAFLSFSFCAYIRFRGNHTLDPGILRTFSAT